MKKTFIGIREARINLSRLIRDVRGGMEIVITDRGTPVARLIPAEGTSLTVEERINNYVSCGLIESCPESNKTEPAPVELPEDYIKRLLREERHNE